MKAEEDNLEKAIKAIDDLRVMALKDGKGGYEAALYEIQMLILKYQDSAQERIKADRADGKAASELYKLLDDSTVMLQKACWTDTGDSSMEIHYQKVKEALEKYKWPQSLPQDLPSDEEIEKAARAYCDDNLGFRDDIVYTGEGGGIHLPNVLADFVSEWLLSRIQKDIK